ncbi:MAG: dihydroxyacetone kinase subunit L [Bryobacteraceae bacterium]|jgi:dihydroxyacetone kinase-like protein
MAATMTTDSIRWAIGRLKEKMDAAAGELNELDGALGDGDLGVTLSRAAQRLLDDRPNLPDDVGVALFQCAQAFTRVTGSTYGTLLATGLMAAAKATRGRSAVPWTEISSLVAAALKAMSDRGKGMLGDKTVLDALEAARRATEGLDEPRALVTAAGQAVDASMAEFRDRPFRQGRARIFGDKGLGRDDPGMVAFKRIIESLA